MFSALATAHIQEPRNVGKLEDATHYGVAGVPGEGPFVELWFRINTDHIQQGTYRTYGCPTSIASASLVAELLTGKKLEVARRFDESDLKVLLGEIPEGKGDCPGRAIAALRNALEKQR